MASELTPPPDVVSSLQRVGILGGTFDPPHIGHLLLAECARLEFGLDALLFIPAGEPYRKTKPGVAAPPRRAVSEGHHRLEMTRLAIAGNPHFAVDPRELARPGNTYTVDTLEALLRDSAFSAASLYLILGSDALADMPYWKTPERILELANVLIARKGPPGPRETATDIVIPPPLLSLLRGRWSQRAGGLLRFDRLPDSLPVVSSMPSLAVSSTLIRGRVNKGLPIRYLVTPEVEAYIADHGLYGALRVEGVHA
jgi:nicotinate-nucleotide adenylyltransferase